MITVIAATMMTASRVDGFVDQTRNGYINPKQPTAQKTGFIKSLSTYFRNAKRSW